MRRALSIAAICAAVLAVSAQTVSAFPLDNCTMSVQSVRADGTVHDKATGPGSGGTEDDPLEVDSNGSVTWAGTTGSQVIKNNSWHIEVFYLPLFRGSSANADGETSADGTVDFRKDAPFRFTGLYFASGGLSGDGGACDGSGWFRAIGDPVGTVPFFAGLVLLILGLALLAWAVLRASVVAGLAGGALTGLALATLLVIFSALPLGALTPLAILAIGIVAGVACWLVGRSMASRRVA
jgi:hypothetical protein